MSTTMAQADKKSYKVKGIIILLSILAISALVWFIDSGVSAPHALSFDLHQSPIPIVILIAVAVVWLAIVVKGVIAQSDLMTSFGWPYYVLGILWFACWLIIGLTRYNAANDVNVKARYDKYAAEKGWKAQ